jgi:aspartyl-tRNA(Asn)/glutamyl-tRNA(Gln) amidotransferase subunit C
MITRQDVEYIAELARLSLGPEETDAFTIQLGAVLEYMEQLNRVDTSAVEPTCFVAPGHDPLRDDEETGSLPVVRALANGPEIKKGFFSIPKVIR